MNSLRKFAANGLALKKKQFKKIAIGDLTIILNEIDRMYTIVCENRKSEYNFPYELVDKIKM